MDISGSGKGVNLLEMANVLSDQMVQLSTQDRIAMPYGLFGDKAIVTTSFGATSAAFLHLVSQVVPGITVLNIRHGHESEETLEFIHRCETRFPIKLVVEKAPHLPVPEIGSKAFEHFRQETKVKPLQRALSKLDIWFWISGVMHDEMETRKSFTMARVRHGVVVLYPILDWTSEDAMRYCIDHDLPLNRHYFDPCKGPDQSLECGLHQEPVAPGPRRDEAGRAPQHADLTRS